MTRAIRAIIVDLSQSERRDSSATPKGGQGKRESARTFGKAAGIGKDGKGKTRQGSQRSHGPPVCGLHSTYTVHEARAKRDIAS